MAARRRGGASAGADPALAPSAAPASKQWEPSTAPVLVAAALVCVFCLCLWKDLLAAAAAPVLVVRNRQSVQGMVTVPCLYAQKLSDTDN